MNIFLPNLRTILSIIFFFCLSFSHAQLKISLDNPKQKFAVGESINVRISSNNYGEGAYEIYLNPRKPEESVIQKGSFTASPGSDGFISLSVKQPGLAFIKVTQSWASATTAFTIDPLSIQLIESEPVDFEAYWQQQKQALAAIPMNPQLSQINTLPNGTKVYALELATVDNRKVYGFLAIPAGSGPFPAILTFPPYGNSPSQPDPLVVTDYAEKGKAISLYISVHNAPVNSVDNEAYKPDDITRREGYYSRLMILAGLRAVDYLTSREDFNGNLALTGNSQGGGLCLQVAGLDNRVTAVMSLSPASCEHDGERFGQASGFPYYVQAAKSQGLDTNLVYKSMPYYETGHFVKHFKGDMMYLIGYRDDVTPAATQFPAYNQHRGKSTLLHMRELGHSNPWEEYYLGQHAFFSQHLKGFQNTHSFKKQFSINAGDDISTDAASIKLEGKISIDGSSINATSIKWTKIEGPGDVTFSSNGALQTAAAFSQEGTYVLRLSADDDYKIYDPNTAMYYTLADYITVKVGQGNNACATDSEKPVFNNCPQNIVLTTTQFSATANWVQPLATDNCSTPTLTSNFSSGQLFPIGVTAINYTATDAKGNQATCQFTVSVTQAVDACLNDMVPPIFSNCPQNIVLTTTENSAIATWQAPTAMDNCSTPSVSSPFSSSQSFPLGTTVVNYTAVDEKNNQATCQFNVSVNKVETSEADLSVSISTSSNQYSPYSNIVYRIVLKNLGATAYSNAKLQFKFPKNTVTGGVVTISDNVTGDWREWCIGSIQCFEWNVNNLAGLDSAILTLPLFILKASEPIEATATLLSSTPTDNNRANNQASATIFPISNFQGGNDIYFLSSKRVSNLSESTMILSPTLVEDVIQIEMAHTTTENIEFNIVNALGVTVQSESRKVGKGYTLLNFDILNLPKETYFIVPKAQSTHFKPLKFIKI